MDIPNRFFEVSGIFLEDEAVQDVLYLITSAREIGSWKPHDAFFHAGSSIRLELLVQGIVAYCSTVVETSKGAINLVTDTDLIPAADKGKSNVLLREGSMVLIDGDNDWKALVFSKPDEKFEVGTLLKV